MSIRYLKVRGVSVQVYTHNGLNYIHVDVLNLETSFLGHLLSEM